MYIHKAGLNKPYIFRERFGHTMHVKSLKYVDNLIFGAA